MQLPHRLVVITPTETTDAYDNPVPQLEYGTDAPRRTALDTAVRSGTPSVSIASIELTSGSPQRFSIRRYHSASRDRYGAQVYQVPATPWLQSASTATRVADHLLAVASAPLPVLGDVEILPDPTPAARRPRPRDRHGRRGTVHRGLDRRQQDQRRQHRQGPPNPYPACHHQPRPTHRHWTVTRRITRSRRPHRACARGCEGSIARSTAQRCGVVVHSQCRRRRPVRALVSRSGSAGA